MPARAPLVLLAFLALAATLAALPAACNAAPFRVDRVSPEFVSPAVDYANVTIYRAHAGSLVFLMRSHATDGVTALNCTRPPRFVASGGVRTAPAFVRGAPGVARFRVRGLLPGRYTLCYVNASANATGAFVSLSPVLSVVGPVSAEHSSLCCEGPFLAGNRTWCTVSARDAAGVPAGSHDTLCKMQISQITDGAGSAVVNYTRLAFVAPGTFRFSFVPMRSGCGGSAGVAYDGSIIGGNRWVFFTVRPGPPVPWKATSQCAVDWRGRETCHVTQYDRLGNAAKTCSFRTNAGGIVCHDIVAGARTERL